MQVHIIKHGDILGDAYNLLESLELDCPECGYEFSTKNISYIIDDTWYGGHIDGFVVTDCPKCKCRFSVRNRLHTNISDWLKLIIVTVLSLIFIALPVALFVLGNKYEMNVLKYTGYGIFIFGLVCWFIRKIRGK